MKEKILHMVDSYWKFDNQQQPISSWHDKQDLLKALEELLQPAVMASDIKNVNECHIGWDCERYGKRCDEECNGCGWWYPLNNLP